MSADRGPNAILPPMSRRRFVQTGVAATVLVHVSSSWWTAPIATAAPGDNGKAKPDQRAKRDATVPADVRHAAVVGPPDGRAHGNVIVRSWTAKQTTTTTWFAGGGRALSIATGTRVDKKGRTKPKPKVHYVDPTRSTVAGRTRLVPLSELEHEIRTEFGDHEWSAMLRRLA